MGLPAWQFAETRALSDAGDAVFVIPVRWAERWHVVVSVSDAAATSITYAASAVTDHWGPAVAGLPDGGTVGAGESWGLSSSDLDAVYALRLVISLDGAGSVVVTGAGLS